LQFVSDCIIYASFGAHGFRNCLTRNRKYRMQVQSIPRIHANWPRVRCALDSISYEFRIGFRVQVVNHLRNGSPELDC